MEAALRRARGTLSSVFTPAPAHRTIILVGILLTLLFVVVVVLSPSPLDTIDFVAYDEMFLLLEDDLPAPGVAIVDVDERSLAELGQWPWPRYRIASLIEQATALGAQSVAVDFLFSEPDRLSLAELAATYQRDRGVHLNLIDLPGDVLDNDRKLAEMVALHPVVLGADLIFEHRESQEREAYESRITVVSQALPGTTGTPPMPVASGMVSPIPVLADAVPHIGAVNTLPDDDGKVRRVPVVFRYGDTWVPSLALGALLAAAGETQAVMRWSGAGVLDIRVGDTVIPTDHQGNMLLSFRADPEDRIAHISAVDLLEGRVDRSLLAGKIVFIGTSASGLGDTHPTPLARSCPGVDLHALAADTILCRDFFSEPGWSRGAQALLVLLCGLLVSALTGWTYITLSALITGAGVVVLALISWTLFERWGIYLSPVPGASMLLVGTSVLTVLRLRFEERRERLLKQSFERYVSTQIVDQIIHSAKPVNLSGERRKVTILMSDIRGFTALSERMPAEHLVQFLNSYFAAMIDIILANEGTLDKFMGDAVLALFGAPIPHPDSALRAVKVAVAMQEKLRELNAQWMDRGQPQIRIGIGISTGEVIVGNIGSARRLEYTAIGQDVNYAQRIESLTKNLSADILVSTTTYEEVKQYVDAEEFGPLTIRGKDEPIYVYGIRRLV